MSQNSENTQTCFFWDLVAVFIFPHLQLYIFWWVQLLTQLNSLQFFMDLTEYLFEKNDDIFKRIRCPNSP